MTLLSVQNLSMAYADNTIFSDISFMLGRGDKVGLIGANGAGKTTLFRLVCALEQPTRGKVAWGKDVSVGYMQQHACSDESVTLFDEVLKVFSPQMEMERELEQISVRIEHGEVSEQLLQRQSSLREAFEAQQGLTYRSLARSCILGLGFSQQDMSLPMSALSGGQRSKASLCRLLLSRADVLLLDEPTNHLDIKSVAWLEQWLIDTKSSFIVISHDRYFLNRVTNRTMEIEGGALYAANAAYDGYLKQKKERLVSMQREYDNTMSEIKRIEGIIEQQRRFNRERNYITIASKQKQIDRLRQQLVEPPAQLSSIRFSFPAAKTVSGNEVLTMQEVSKSFDGKPVFENFNLQVLRGERVFIIGENGCGKSTALKIAVSMLSRSSGRVKLGAGVKIGYYDQSLALLGREKTVLDEVWDDYRQMNETQIRSALALFLFKGEQVYKKMSALSGGEKARVALLKLMLSGSNLLVLDEPTNHLDLLSRQALENAFEDYDGTLLTVSHDRYLINRLATRVVSMTKDGCESFVGNYDSYLEQTAGRVQQAEQPQRAPKKENEYKLKKQLESEIRRTRGKISRLEARIDELDGEKQQLEALLSSPEPGTDYKEIMEMSEKLRLLSDEQEQLMLEWQECCEALEALEARV